MKRILTTTIASSLLALMLPMAASAHNGRNDVAHRAGEHHRRHHHHARAHTVVFAPAAVTPTTGTTPTETPAPADEAAGTVASFEGGVLKITLADGSVVTGKVTEATEIQCGCPGHDGNSDNGDDHGGFGSGGPGSSDFHGDDENGGAPGQTTAGCGSTSLVTGAKVKEAELSLSGAGAVWEKVELAQ